MDRLQPYLLDWKCYFGMAQAPRVWRELDEWRISANVTNDFGSVAGFEMSVLSCVEWIVGSGCLKVVERLRN